MQKIYSKQKKGFTLIELIVVIAILGILLTAGFASYTNTRRTSRDARRKVDLEQIRSALELYRSDNFDYPDATGNTEIDLKPVLIAPVPYVNANSFPKDPDLSQGFYYYYQRNPSGGGNNTYRICAYLEAPKADDPACPVAAVVCKTTGGTVNCNYGLTQP